MAAGGQVVALTADGVGWHSGCSKKQQHGEREGGRAVRLLQKQQGEGGGGDGGQAVAHRGKKEKNMPVYGSVVS